MKPYITEWYFKFDAANMLRGVITVEENGCHPDEPYAVGWQTWVPNHPGSWNAHVEGHYKSWMTITTHKTYEEAVVAMIDQYQAKKLTLL